MNETGGSQRDDVSGEHVRSLNIISSFYICLWKPEWPLHFFFRRSPSGLLPTKTHQKTRETLLRLIITIIIIIPRALRRK
jgi:hypothetical protein